MDLPRILLKSLSIVCQSASRNSLMLVKNGLKPTKYMRTLSQYAVDYMSHPLFLILQESIIFQNTTIVASTRAERKLQAKRL